MHLSKQLHPAAHHASFCCTFLCGGQNETRVGRAGGAAGAGEAAAVSVVSNKNNNQSNNTGGVHPPAGAGHVRPWALFVVCASILL
jgi:hypothetical protein